MKKRYKVLVTFGVVVVIVACLYFFTDWFSLMTGYLILDGEESFARCLTEKGFEFYYGGDVGETREIFGEEFGLIDSVDCGFGGELCHEIDSVPAWAVNGEIEYGFKDLEELGESSGC